MRNSRNSAGAARQFATLTTALDIAHIPTRAKRLSGLAKKPMSDIWRWPVLKLKMAIRSRQRTTISTPNIISDPCAPKRHNKQRFTKTRSTKANPGALKAPNCCPFPFCFGSKLLLPETSHKLFYQSLRYSSLIQSVSNAAPLQAQENGHAARSTLCPPLRKVNRRPRLS